MKPDIEKINAVLKTVEETLDQNIKDLHSISCEEDVPDVLCSCCDRNQPGFQADAYNRPQNIKKSRLPIGRRVDN